MKKEEVGILVEGKKKKGQVVSEAYEEVRILNNTQKTFKENTRKIDSLQIQLEKSEEKVKSLQDKIFRLEFAKDKEQEIKNEQKDNTKEVLMKLSRMRRLMEKRTYTKEELAETFLIETREINDFIKFFNDSKIMEIKIEGNKIIRIK
jgi:septal ring factor EnvC (AmiA/AmiB activator)